MLANRTSLILLTLAGASMMADAAFAQAPMGSEFTYQGKLNLSGSPINDTADFEFTLWDAASDGNMIGSAVEVSNVTVVDGIFTVQLNFGQSAFNGDARWLEISVASPSGGTLTMLSPRQPLSAEPYALALPALRTDTSGSSPNIIGGHSDNSVAGGVAGATIGGGGSESLPQSVTCSYGTIAGGRGNSVSGESDAAVGGGWGNTASGYAATVAGGINNTASEYVASVAGGILNIASGPASTVSGGQTNFATATGSAVVGGLFNTAGGVSSTVAGGLDNTADGSYSFVSGRRAKANHDGTFVWADSTDADFASTGQKQFLIRAGGGVGIGKNDPATALDVNGTVTAAAFVGDGSGLTNIPADNLGDHTATQNLNLNGHYLSGDGDNEGIFVDDAGNVGIGTTTTGAALDVNGATLLNGNVTMSGGDLSVDRGAAVNVLTRTLLLGGARGTGSSPYASIQFQNYDNNDSAMDYIGAEILSHNDSGADSGDLRFSVNDGTGGGTAEAMRIDRDGNVGIGTSAPADKLHVCGDVRVVGNISASGSILALIPGACPDYVFGEDYALRSLDELSAFLEEHKHLPNVPSAKEVESEGIDLGGFQMRLLEKTEELTLYTLKQHQQLKEKDAEIAGLNERIERLESLVKDLTSR